MLTHGLAWVTWVGMVQHDDVWNEGLQAWKARPVF